MSVRGKVSVAAVVVATFVAGILGSTLGSNLLGVADQVGSDSRAVSVSPSPDTQHPTSSPLTFEDTFVQIAERVNPTVVQIRSERVTTQQGWTVNPFEGTPFEDMFRRNMPPSELRSKALGSGVIINGDGHIITNNHVVQGSEELEVQLYDGEYYDATVIGTDPNSDLAVIKIEANDALPTIPFGTFEEIRIGQWVLAFGSPLSEDLGNTVTAGIVSAIGRTSLALSQLNTFSSFIQTDAAINPGNSGGPLVNLRGELVGINSAIFSRSGGYQGIAFSIPVDVVRNVTTQLIETGSVQRGFLGVRFGPVSPSLAEAVSVPRGAAQIESVEQGSAADKARLKPGDIIVAVDGNQLKDYNQLRTIIANKLPGQSVQLSIVRDAEQTDVTVQLGTRDEEAIAANDSGSGTPDESESLDGLGLSLSDASPDLLARYGYSEEGLKGVIVTNVEQNSDSYREAELRPGDLITEVDKKSISSRAEFLRAIGSVGAGDMFLIRVNRPAGESTRTFITALKKPSN
jgi:serine protease Do